MDRSSSLSLPLSKIVWTIFGSRDHERNIVEFPRVIFVFSLLPRPLHRQTPRKGIFEARLPRQRFTKRMREGRERSERSSTLELISRRIARIPPTPLLDFPRPVYMRRMRGSRNGGGRGGEEERSTVWGGRTNETREGSRMEKVAGRKRKETTDRGRG